MSDHTTWCPQCGPGVFVDEDGCCRGCGSTAVGDGASEACAAADHIDHLERIKAAAQAVVSAHQDVVDEHLWVLEQALRDEAASE